jgi:antitoxin CptB
MDTIMDTRRKRVLYRANHRGTKEADVMLGGFATAHVRDLSDSQLDTFEALLEELDVEIMDWVIGRQPLPARHDTELFKMILSYKPYA